MERAAASPGTTWQDLERECSQLKPYRRLHWTAYPIEGGRVESSGGESYIRFTFIEPENLGMRTIPGTNIATKYFGSITNQTLPELVTTSVHVEDLVRFRGILKNEDVIEAYGPTMNSDARGRTLFRVTIDGGLISIPKQSISRVRLVFFPDWKQQTPINLFRGRSGTSFDGLDEIETTQRPRK